MTTSCDESEGCFLSKVLPEVRNSENLLHIDVVLLSCFRPLVELVQDPGIALNVLKGRQLNDSKSDEIILVDLPGKC